MTETWITASGVSGMWVDPESHLLQDPAAEKRLHFHLPTSFHRRQQGPLLPSTSVIFSPGAPLLPYLSSSPPPRHLWAFASTAR